MEYLFASLFYSHFQFFFFSYLFNLYHIGRVVLLLLLVNYIENADKVKTSKKRDRKSNDAIKCVVVGEGKVGKTNLILGYLQHRFTTEHVPTASDIYNCKPWEMK